MGFRPFVYPKPDMLVQEGARVEIHGLTSKKGRSLNGLQGTAIHFFPSTGRWSVLVKAKQSQH